MHAVDVGIGDGQVLGGTENGLGRVHRLLVLAEAHVADEPRIAEDQALAADDRLALLAGPGDLGAVEFGVLRIGHQGVAGLAVGRAVVVVDQGGDVLAFHQRLEAVPGRGLVAEAGAQGEGLGVLAEAVLVDGLVAQAHVEDDVAGQGLGQRGRRRGEDREEGATGQALAK
ncbi:hypothetical protein DJ019_08445 [Phenylobacterium kunshanense]|uniref:Uncharacterized protein n=1 Tax=Phenylobacterium kunshanense TaxID=1445034 RepID=A0A328BK20_9CAUL|nr:hypothetical protein DJ019_08445 [Phenylobacterium kunshanense]